jgi:ElaB/YqjD/DUF883 family membrane-anchored ribosome-binding protein
MKTKIYTLIFISVLGFTPLSYAQTNNGNTSIEEVQKETQDLLQTIGSYTVDQKDEAMQQAREGLDEFDERVDTLEYRVGKNWDKMSKAAREETRENLKELRKERNQVAEWYGSMKTSSVDAWVHMKKGFSDAYKVMQTSWEKSENEFESKK